MATVKSKKADVSSIPIALTKGYYLICQLFYSLWWPIYVFNTVVYNKLPAIISHQCSTTVSLETYPLYSLLGFLPMWCSFYMTRFFSIGWKNLAIKWVWGRKKNSVDYTRQFLSKIFFFFAPDTYFFSKCLKTARLSSSWHSLIFQPTSLRLLAPFVIVDK